jgi:hypothetical protein
MANDSSNNDRARAFSMLMLGGSHARSTPAHWKDESSMVTHNPAPDASEPSVPNGVYQEIKLR